MRQILRKTMTKLSVNINKVATLRNARGGDTPNVVKVALDCEAFGADGITVHPRPDERHIRRADYSIKVVKRFNHIFYDTLRSKMMWGADGRR